MRQLLIALAAVALFAVPARADKWEVSGVHLCCQSCVRAVDGVLKNVEGVSEVACDRTKKTVTFTAKDDQAGRAAYKALTEAGFYGTGTSPKGTKVELEAPAKGGKAEAVTVKNVHLCCNACKNAVKALFKDATVEFPARNEAKISGKDLDKVEVLKTLRKAGFNGKVE